MSKALLMIVPGRKSY